jgi:hypothetical protein
MNELGEPTTGPLVLLVDGTRNVYEWEYEF